MSRKTITISVTPAGTATVEAEGFQGCGCADATEQIELVLGGGQRARKEKPEFHMPTGGTVSQKATF